MKTFVEDFLRSLGAVEKAPRERYLWYPFTLDTALGPLHIRPYETWVACRFEEPQQTHKVFGGKVSHLTPNPYSGKWNIHWSREDSPDKVVQIVRDHFASLARINHQQGY